MKGLTNPQTKALELGDPLPCAADPFKTVRRMETALFEIGELALGLRALGDPAFDEPFHAGAAIEQLLKEQPSCAGKILDITAHLTAYGEQLSRLLRERARKPSNARKQKSQERKMIVYRLDDALKSSKGDSTADRARKILDEVNAQLAVANLDALTEERVTDYLRSRKKKKSKKK